MKSLKFIMLAMMLGIVGSAFAQTAQTAKPAEKTVYFVQIPHTQEQCMNLMNDMKGKGDMLLSKFEFGCMSGDHTAYAFLEGPSEESVRQMLPADEQKSAKIEKVNKFSAADLEKMHKDHM